MDILGQTATAATSAGLDRPSVVLSRHVAGYVGDLLPASYNMLRTVLSSSDPDFQARGIISRTLIEHLHRLVQLSINQPSGLTRAAKPALDERHVDTFDRFSAQEVTREDLVAILSHRLNDESSAELALAMIELRTDLSLAHTGSLQLNGVGKIESSGNRDTVVHSVGAATAIFNVSGDEWRKGRRANRRLLRSLVDQMRMSVTTRPPCGYRITMPPVALVSSDSGGGSQTASGAPSSLLGQIDVLEFDELTEGPQR
jgi:hypothetical protein